MTNQIEDKGPAKLLELVTTVELPAVRRFVAADKFRERQTIDGVKIHDIRCDGRVRRFLTGKTVGKSEAHVRGATLRVHKPKEAELENGLVNAAIMADLGNSVETTLSHFWELLKKQGVGQPGDFLVNGGLNRAFIRDTNQGYFDLWVIFAFWNTRYSYHGWDIGIDSVGSIVLHTKDFRVVSR